MASHYELIGLNVKSIDDLKHYYQNGIELGDKIETEMGSYFLWKIGRGIELWLQANKDGKLGINPHYFGTSEFKAEIKKRNINLNHTLLDGSLQCLSEEGGYPFIVDLPDFATYKNIKIPQSVILQITAFPHNINIYESEEDYYKKNTSENTFAAEHFVPSGMFNTENSLEADALFGGKVIKIEKIKNLITRKDIYCAKTKTYGGEIDVLLTSSLLEGKELKVGNNISGHFWLSAKILDKHETKKKAHNFSLKGLIQLIKK